MRTKAKLLALAGVGLWLVAQAAQANIFVVDRREQRDANLPPFRSVGVLNQRAAGAGGTAFLVSSCHIATAYHVAFVSGRNPRTGAVEISRPRIGQTADFVVGPDPRVAYKFAAKTRATVVAFGRFSRSDFKGRAKGVRHDIRGIPFSFATLAHRPPWLAFPATFSPASRNTSSSGAQPRPSARDA